MSDDESPPPKPAAAESTGQAPPAGAQATSPPPAAPKAPRHIPRALKLFGFAIAIAVLVAAVAVFFVYLMRDAPSERDFATPVFAASAALVALLLPAAGLAGPYAMGRAFEWIELLVRTQSDEERTRIENTARPILTDIRRSVAPLMIGFVFVTLSFPISGVAMIGVTGCTLGQPRDHILVGTAMSLLVVAVGFFLPFTLRLLDRRLYSQALDTLFPPES